MTIDPFGGYSAGLESPYSNALAITPDDDLDLPVVPRGIWCGVGGDIRMTFANGETVTFKQADAASNGWPFRPTRIHATGTTATDIVIVW